MAEAETELQRELGDRPPSHEPRGRPHPSAKEYIRIGLILAGLTAFEVLVYYLDTSTAVLISTLLVVAVIKFTLVVLWFMHLRFDDRRYARFFVMGLAGAATLYLIVLITFRTFLG
ncbi:MAG TPA: cytochrome C oxidase subunit IV family protein [Actinomycetota bacterium]|jgi:caa(3)-type oxidase subunit IV